MNLEEIKERHKQDDIDMGKVSKGQLHADRAYLISIIEQAEKALTEFVDKHFHGGSKANREDYACFAIPTADIWKLREALKAIQGDE